MIVGEGCNVDGTSRSIQALPAQMKVDYVSVWDMNPYITEDME